MLEETETIIKKLDTLVQLVAVAVTEGRKQADQIRLLALAGFKASQIAQILGTTRNTVSVALSNLRRDGRLPRGGREDK